MYDTYYTLPVTVPTVSMVVPNLTLSLLPSSWYHRVYQVSSLPPKSSGGSHPTVMLVLVVAMINTFLGSDGGPVYN